ncbi:MAG: hydrogen peroxide-inducible genes activator [Paludibacter sp.]|jgi:LysR family hydrogen peroxide-inducible transcriptional activator|nr:hydrogen peroxide-inducible genes activator [Paludibacter sp.]MBP6634930.1 hydrogen peroxide-inducible genes activator [Paludibacter sp.]
MTLQQLEYIIALDKTRHFVRAAEMCGVTQPTLSAMIQKLEDELDCRIFDRSSHPIVPTEVGAMILQQAQVVMFNVHQLRENVLTQKGSVAGSLSLAIIPTVAPYLLPELITLFRRDYVDISLKISEMRTETIIEKLHSAEIDMAILSTPLDDPKILEVPLYYEKFVAYISPNEPLYLQDEVSTNDMQLDHLWVLEEGHCLRNQVFNFCKNKTHSAIYEAGSIDTLVKIVDRNGGYTVIPELHINLLTDVQKQHLRKIVRPEATREIALVIRHDYVREGLMNAVANSIKQIIPQHMLDARLKKFAIKL